VFVLGVGADMHRGGQRLCVGMFTCGVLFVLLFCLSPGPFLLQVCCVQAPPAAVPGHVGWAVPAGSCCVPDQVQRVCAPSHLDPAAHHTYQGTTPHAAAAGIQAEAHQVCMDRVCDMGSRGPLHG
jgi:hypothetical protein